MRLGAVLGACKLALGTWETEERRTLCDSCAQHLARTLFAVAVVP